jgi:micrococcal nuclease
VAAFRTVIAAFVIALVPAAAEAQRVTKVPDGDTVVVDGVGRVRLLGIRSADDPALQLGSAGPPPRQDRPGPTPPLVAGRVGIRRNRPSRDFLRKLALGKTVRIEYDPLVDLSRDRDRVAYLFLEDGTLLNAEMLKAGRARLDLTRQFVREEEFKRLEQEAKSASVGIWVR